MKPRGMARQETHTAQPSLFPACVCTRVCVQTCHAYIHPSSTERSEQDLALVLVTSIRGNAGEEADVFRADPADHQGPV